MKLQQFIAATLENFARYRETIGAVEIWLRDEEPNGELTEDFVIDKDNITIYGDVVIPLATEGEHDKNADAFVYNEGKDKMAIRFWN